MLVHHIISVGVGLSRYWCVTLSTMLVVYFVASVIIDALHYWCYCWFIVLPMLLN